MSAPEDPDTSASVREPRQRGVSWRELAARACFAIPALFALLMLVFQFVDPFILVFCLVFAALGWWIRRGSRASLIVGGILAVIFILMNVPFIAPTLSVPASFIDFLLTAFVLIAAITVAISAFTALRAEDGPTSGARTMVGIAGGLAVLAVAAAVVGRLTYDGGDLQQRDLTVTTIDTEFDPDELATDGGTVGVFITNEDPTLHTFTVDELDVDIAIPQNSTARVEFEAEPGEYEIVCKPHEAAGMTGTLRVQ